MSLEPGPFPSRLEVVFVAALAGGLGLSMIKTAWPSYVLARGWLAWHLSLPWSLMDFLADAHRRGVLRQVGAVYQFRHIELQHRLANRDTDKDGLAHSLSPPRERADHARPPGQRHPGRE